MAAPLRCSSYSFRATVAGGSNRWVWEYFWVSPQVARGHIQATKQAAFKTLAFIGSSYEFFKIHNSKSKWTVLPYKYSVWDYKIIALNLVSALFNIL